MPETPPEINTSEPHPARIYDYFIGGKNHFAADRETAAKVLRRSPAAHIAARENRSFLGRAVTYLTAEAGIRQFLDIGTGLPTTDNVHEVAQEIAPSARVVYVDNDPIRKVVLTSEQVKGPSAQRGGLGRRPLCAQPRGGLWFELGDQAI
jgi:hypothetical protein